VGAVYIHEKHHNDSSISRYSGWWGYNKATRFKMEKGFKPQQGATGWQVSTPSMLLYAAHKASLDIFEEAGWKNILVKQKLLNNYLWFLLDKVNSNSNRSIIEIITPQNESERGCQVSMLMQERGRTIFDSLSKAGVMTDWREPNVIRIAPVPLYNTYEEVWRFANILKEVIAE
jgi:kynureninase